MPKLCPAQAHSGILQHTPAHEAVVILFFHIKPFAKCVKEWWAGTGFTIH